MRHNHVGPSLLAGAGYIVASTVPPLVAGMSPSPVPARWWRVAAWILSLVVFVLHLAAVRRRRTRRSRAATFIAFGVALGAAAVAALGPLRAHWAEPGRLRLILLSVVAWPLLTGIPAFCVALLGGILLDRARGRPDRHSRVA